MKLNAGKTKTMVVPISRTGHPQLTPLTLGGTVLKETADHVIFDAKMTFDPLRITFTLFPVLQLRGLVS